MTRVAVVGNGGSGKTWLALRLADALQVPVIHLDLYRYDTEGQRRDDDVVVFLGLPAVVCLVGVLTRRLRNRGRRVEDAAHVDRFDAAFVRYVLTYDLSMRPRLLTQLAQAQRRVVRVRSRRQARALVGQAF